MNKNSYSHFYLIPFSNPMQTVYLTKTQAHHLLYGIYIIHKINYRPKTNSRLKIDHHKKFITFANK